jgi:hypothetical protein
MVLDSILFFQTLTADIKFTIQFHLPAQDGFASSKMVACPGR